MNVSTDLAENISTCFNFSANELNINIAVTVSLHAIAITACIVTIIFIFGTKQNHIFVNRLVLYLMLVASIWSLVIIAQVIPVESPGIGIRVRRGWKDACATIGFLSQIVESAKILVVCWIVLYLLLLVVFKYNASKPGHEAFGLITVIVLPLLLDWVPFRWEHYGISGMWCWIRLTTDDCRNIETGIELMLGVEYVPVLLALLFTLISFSCIVIALCRRAHRTEIKWKWASVYQKGLAEAAALMVYPFIYGMIFIFRVLHRTYYVIQIKHFHPPNYTLWLAYSTFLGTGGILVPFLYLLRPSNLKKFSVCRRLFLKKESASVVVYRSSSLISTEAPSEGEAFADREQGVWNVRDSSLFYKSVLDK